LGDGQFVSRPGISSDADGAISVSAADLDGDGDMDALSASLLDEKVAWYENLDGAGNFGPAQTISTEVLELRWVIAPDLDGDGDRDVLSAAAVPSTGVVWHENDGAGYFGAPQVIDPSRASAIFAVDVDGDLRTDVISVHENGGDLSWHGNRSNDCNGNGVPDSCEDCDGTNIADVCKIAAGVSLDCNDNGVPDNCDTQCSVGCDLDGDLCLNDVDSNPGDRHVCGDTDGDGCDDCWIGWYFPGFDGLDTDSDGYCDAGDCAPDNAVIWSDPGSIDTLEVSHAMDVTSLSWQAPDEWGAVIVRYDTLRSPVDSDFGGAVCLATDEMDRTTDDTDPTAPGSLSYYLIRVENDCPGGTGSMGAGSDGVPRTGVSCP
jgi:hypothetical protein